MKKHYLFFFISFTNSIFSQIYEFQTIKDIEGTPVISQDQTGTCWSFSTTSFLESEIIRLTGKKLIYLKCTLLDQSIQKKLGIM